MISTHPVLPLSRLAAFYMADATTVSDAVATSLRALRAVLMPAAYAASVSLAESFCLHQALASRDSADLLQSTSAVLLHCC